MIVVSIAVQDGGVEGLPLYLDGALARVLLLLWTRSYSNIWLGIGIRRHTSAAALFAPAVAMSRNELAAAVVVRLFLVPFTAGRSLVLDASDRESSCWRDL